jgi:tetrameric-type glycyl-tRNA synthetase beta subunit
MMRWLPQEVSPPFVRPIRWILALAGDRVIPLEAFGLSSGRETYGQRILFPGKITVTHASEWLSHLRSAGVEPSWARRTASIRAQVVRKMEELSAVTDIDESLVSKCAGISESPYVFLGKIEPEFLKLPARLIKTVLKENMNFFALQDRFGHALPYYIGVSGYQPGDVAAMIEGTQNVVVGRLSDGTFYFDGDLATPLEDLREKLKSQVLQEGMGTLFDKTERISRLASALAEQVSFFDGNGFRRVSTAEVQVAREAGLYCKADLRSGCVQEFPDEMQGVMGGVLVRHQKSSEDQFEAIARAIEEHYEPNGASASLPSTASGQLVSLADKLDTLALFVSSGFDIKGNKDPFGLRRSAISILRLLGLESSDRSGLRLGIRGAVDLAVRTLRDAGFSVQADLDEKVLQFLLGRLRAAWRETYDPGAVEAVCAKLDSQSLFEARLLAEATSAALKETGQLSLINSLIPYRRCRNLTQDISYDRFSSFSVETRLFQEEVEHELLRAIQAVESDVERYLEQSNYRSYLSALMVLGKPLADFFEKVMVNADDPQIRSNRLALLIRVRVIYEKVADFSRVQLPGAT